MLRAVHHLPLGAVDVRLRRLVDPALVAAVLGRVHGGQERDAEAVGQRRRGRRHEPVVPVHEVERLLLGELQPGGEHVGVHAVDPGDEAVEVARPARLAHAVHDDPRALLAQRRVRAAAREHLDLHALADELLGELAHMAGEATLDHGRVLPGEDERAGRHGGRLYRRCTLGRDCPAGRSRAQAGAARRAARTARRAPRTDPDLLVAQRPRGRGEDLQRLAAEQLLGLGRTARALRQRRQRQRPVGGDEHDVAARPAVQELRRGHHGQLGEHLGQGGDLAAHDRQRRGVDHVEHVHAVLAQHAAHVTAQLHREQVGGHVGAAERVADDEVGRSVGARRSEQLARIANADPQRARRDAGRAAPARARSTRSSCS